MSGRGYLLLLVSLALMGCHAKPPVTFSSDLKMADLASAHQLLAGFHEQEAGQWRWTKRRFAVVLKAPVGSEQFGTTVRLQFSIPSSQIQKLGPLTISADVGDESLSPQTFAAEGPSFYSRTIDRRLISGSLLPVVFTVDKALAPWQADGRELAVVVSEVSVE